MLIDSSLSLLLWHIFASLWLSHYREIWHRNQSTRVWVRRRACWRDSAVPKDCTIDIFGPTLQWPSVFPSMQWRNKYSWFSPMLAVGVRLRNCCNYHDSFFSYRTIELFLIIIALLKRVGGSQEGWCQWHPKLLSHTCSIEYYPNYLYLWYAICIRRRPKYENVQAAISVLKYGTKRPMHKSISSLWGGGAFDCIHCINNGFVTVYIKHNWYDFSHI